MTVSEGRLTTLKYGGPASVILRPYAGTALHSTDIERDRDALAAGLTLPWNSGVVEGHVNRIKMLKHQTPCRAGIGRLRRPVPSCSSCPALLCSARRTSPSDRLQARRGADRPQAAMKRPSSRDLY